MPGQVEIIIATVEESEAYELADFLKTLIMPYIPLSARVIKSKGSWASWASLDEFEDE